MTSTTDTSVTAVPTMDDFKQEVMRDRMTAQPKRAIYWLQSAVDLDFSQDEVDELADFLKNLGLRVDSRVIPTLFKNKQVRNDLGSLPQTFEELAAAFAARQEWECELFKIRVRVAEAGEKWFTETGSGIANPNTISNKDAFTQLYLWSSNNRFMDNLKSLGMAFEQWRQKQRQLRLQKLYNDIKFIRRQDDLWHQFASMITADPARVHLTVAVLQSFIWQTKRKMNSQSITNHMLPIVGGRTGNGKSVTVRKLLNVLGADAWTNGNFSEIEDANNVDKFTWTPVVFMDEMEKSNKADQNAIKRFLTQDSISYRVFHTQSHDEARIISTFIGTSNEQMQDIIPDTTSSRRFWYIRTPDDMKKHWDALGKIDYMALWTSVNEAKENPITPFLGEIEAIQHNEQRRKTSIELWLEHQKEQPEKNLTPSAWYLEYVEWERTYNPTTAGKITAAKFSREMQALADSGAYERIKEPGNTRAFRLGVPGMANNIVNLRDKLARR